MSTSQRTSSTVLKTLLYYPPELECFGPEWSTPGWGEEGSFCIGTTSKRSNTRLTFPTTNQRPGGIIERPLPTGSVEVDRSG